MTYRSYKNKSLVNGVSIVYVLQSGTCAFFFLKSQQGVVPDAMGKALCLGTKGFELFTRLVPGDGPLPVHGSLADLVQQTIMQTNPLD